MTRRLGLALSGGGVRAAAFHLGVLSKLHELGLLEKVDVISTVSGGSITGAYYLLAGHDFSAFKDRMIRKLQQSIEIRLLLNWRTPIAAIWPGYSTTDVKAAVYDSIYFDGKTLSALALKPQIIINATNLVTGKNFKMSQKFIGDWKIGYDGSPDVMPISFAVAASTAVPGIFQPIRLATKTYFRKPKIAAPLLALCDGGVYDNQGTHGLTSDRLEEKNQRCTHIIVSDASAPFDSEVAPPLRRVSVLRRQSDVMMARIKNIQFQQLLYGEHASTIKTAYFSIDWSCDGILERLAMNGERCATRGLTEDVATIARKDASAHDRDAAIGSALRKLAMTSLNSHLDVGTAREVSLIGTRLRALSEREVSLLVQHGASLCELQVRLYLPDLVALPVEGAADA